MAVHAEPILLVAALRALLLQALHPRPMAAMAQLSDYRSQPWRRLMRTANYVGTVIYGTTEEAQAAGRRIRALHSRLWATDPRSGETFRIDDPELLRWVHVTEVESFLGVARRAGVALTDAEADAYYVEQRRAAELVGLTGDDVPGSQAEVGAYYDRMQPQLAVTKEAAEALGFILAPPMPWGLGLTPVGAAYTGVAALAVGLLPSWARRHYGLPALRTTDLAATLSARALRLGLSALPQRLYEGPQYRVAMHRARAAAVAAPNEGLNR